MEKFSDFIGIMIINPFGDRLFQSIHDIATELELPDHLIKDLKKKVENNNGSQRRSQRKPATPSMKAMRGSGKATPLNKKFIDKEV